MNLSQIISFISGVADLNRNTWNRGKYQDVPLTPPVRPKTCRESHHHQARTMASPAPKGTVDVQPGWRDQTLHEANSLRHQGRSSIPGFAEATTTTWTP